MNNNIFVSEKGSYTDLYSQLFAERIIFLTTEIDDESANLIKAQLLYLDKISNEPIKMYIDCVGGSVYSGLGIIDTMEYISAPIETINTGLAASMAAVVLCCGDVRSALPNSRTMIHQPMAGIYGQSADIEILSKEVIRIKNDLYKIISKKTGKSITDVHNDADRDHWMSAKEAKKYGLIDKIVKKQ